MNVGSLVVREMLVQRPAELTLDTLEHRWLRNQLIQIQRTLGLIVDEHTQAQESSPRRKETLSRLTNIESRLSQLLRLEPLDEADGETPIGFASLQLVSAPGYREAYRTIMLLKMGIRLEGDLLSISVKDLEVLYEYWTFLTIISLLQKNLTADVDLSQLFRVEQKGLSVHLQQGVQQTVAFESGSDRRITVSYNPKLGNNETTLFAQKPDVLIELKEHGWPKTRLICDAKYRLDASEDYKQRFGSYGPPEDAINVLHRYRDAILDDENVGNESKLKRSVVQAASLFPLEYESQQDFRQSRLWRSLEKIGIGAIPALPSNTSYLSEWLLNAIRQGGWAMADRVIPHSANEKAMEWRLAASDPVLVGVLRRSRRQEHLDWILNERIYYVPYSRSQNRFFATKQLAIYVPSGLREPPGIRYIAEVDTFERLIRSKIPTPWVPSRNSEAVMMVYHLKEFRRLKSPIIHIDGERTRFRQARWTTRLAIEMARSLGEIRLETEPEWRLYSILKARNITFKLRLISAKLQDPNNPKGRAWFSFMNGLAVRYDGTNHFLLRKRHGIEAYYDLDHLMEVLCKPDNYGDAPIPEE